MRQIYARTSNDCVNFCCLCRWANFGEEYSQPVQLQWTDDIGEE